MGLNRNIGKNIREVRLEKGLSQDKLAQMCGFSNTTLSAYENSKKFPNLDTTAVIAERLNVSIERLYYGDENNAFISAAPDYGRKIVNAIYFLWESGVIGYYENYVSGGVEMAVLNDGMQHRQPVGLMLQLTRHANSIRRLIAYLNDYKKNEMTYDNPDEYLEMLLSSVAKEINKDLEEHERKKKSSGDRDGIIN